jgi:hypothetical protein
MTYACGREQSTECPTCGARIGEECPYDSGSIKDLLDLQKAVSAGQAASCNPDDGVCEACQ